MHGVNTVDVLHCGCVNVCTQYREPVTYVFSPGADSYRCEYHTRPLSVGGNDCDIVSFKAKSIEHCQAECDGSAQCESILYVIPSFKCTLLSRKDFKLDFDPNLHFCVKGAL